MDPRAIVVAILALCLVLVVLVYAAGVEVGRGHRAPRAAPGPAAE